jgi:hypothetical protein
MVLPDSPVSLSWQEIPATDDVDEMVLRYPDTPPPPPPKPRSVPHRPLRERCNITWHFVLCSREPRTPILISNTATEDPSDAQKSREFDSASGEGDTGSSSGSQDQYYDAENHGPHCFRYSFADLELSPPIVVSPDLLDAYGLAFLSAVLPNFFLAVAHDELLPVKASRRVFPEGDFTHVLSITTEGERRDFYEPGYVYHSVNRDGLPRLRFIVTPPHTSCDQVRLTDNQLCISRDFIALALSYDGGSESLLGRPNLDVRVLLTTHYHCAADAIAIVVCLLCYVTLCSARQALNAVGDLKRLQSIWRSAVINDECLEMIEEAANRQLSTSIPLD